MKDTQKKMKTSGYYSQKNVYPFTSKVQKLLHSFISAGSYNYVPKLQKRLKELIKQDGPALHPHPSTPTPTHAPW